MPLQKNRIYFLLDAFTSKRATSLEEKELMDWMSQAEEDGELKDYMQEVWNSFNKDVPANSVDWDQMFNYIMEKEKVVFMKPLQKRFSWSRLAAAVVFILLISAGGYLYFPKQSNQEVITAPVTQELKNDVVAPQSNKAVLMLADGSVIELDAASEGALAIQGDVKVEKSAEGQIVYKGNSLEVKMNTLTVPRGSKPVQLVLADGSNVWLNVASSITYPTAFAGDERKVEINGEVYFEIAHDNKRPFHVKKGDLNIEVLGTHFNVNTYEDESAMRVTLLEGSVKVDGGVNRETAKILKPGQQALMSLSAKQIRVQTVDVDQVMAWKNGLFSFDQANLNAVMRQLTKWYDVDVEYQGDIPTLMFGGDIERSLSLQQTLKILEKSGVHFKIEGKKIMVLP